MHNQVVSRDEWLDARIELLRREKELTRLTDEVARQAPGRSTLSAGSAHRARRP